jgi:hypothetical protein
MHVLFWEGIGFIAFAVRNRSAISINRRLARLTEPFTQRLSGKPLSLWESGWGEG